MKPIHALPALLLALAVAAGCSSSSNPVADNGSAVNSAAVYASSAGVQAEANVLSARANVDRSRATVEPVTKLTETLRQYYDKKRDLLRRALGRLLRSRPAARSGIMVLVHPRRQWPRIPTRQGRSSCPPTRSSDRSVINRWA